MAWATLELGVGEQAWAASWGWQQETVLTQEAGGVSFLLSVGGPGLTLPNPAPDLLLALAGGPRGRWPGL